MGPIDYTMQVLNPVQSLLDGYAQRLGQENAVRQMDQQDVSLGQGQQRIDMAQEQMMYERQQAERARAMQEAEIARQREAQRTFADFLINPNKTYDDVVRIAQSNPEVAQAAVEYWGNVEEANKAGEVSFAKGTIAALQNNPQIAKDRIQARVDDFEAKGDKQNADLWRAQLALLDAGEEGKNSVMGNALVVLAEQLTPDDMKKFMESLGMGGQDFTEATKTRMQLAAAAGLEPGTQEYKDFMGRNGSQTVIDMGGGTSKQIFDAISEENKTVRSVITGYNALSEAKKAVDAGIISGFGADNILAFQKLGAALGLADPELIQNTETFRAAIAPQVAAMIKATVGSAQLSNADREFAEKAAGGNITLDDGSIKRLLSIMDKGAKVAIKSYKERLDKVYPDTPEFARERALFDVTVPSEIGDNAPDINSGGTGSGTPSQQTGAPSQQSAAPDISAIHRKVAEAFIKNGKKPLTSGQLRQILSPEEFDYYMSQVSKAP